MPKKGNKRVGEPRRFEPVSDHMVLAALDRAERHSHREERGVPLGAVIAHLGFVRTGGWTTRQLRPQLDALVAGGLVGTLRRHSIAIWELTETGRERLVAHRASGEVDELPESPQHRAWRDARTSSAARIDRFAMELRRDLAEAITLVNRYRQVRSDRWFELAARLSHEGKRLGSARHCIFEWPEPDDARRDADDRSDPGDERLSEPELRRRRYLRSGRRSTFLWRDLHDEDLGAKPATPNPTTITVPAELVGDLRQCLHSQLGAPAEGILDAIARSDRETHPAYEPHLGHLGAVCAVLDLIGWTTPRQPVATTLDLTAHHDVVTGALDFALQASVDDVDEAAAADAERAARGEPAKGAATLERTSALREFAACVKRLSADLERQERTNWEGSR
jgi:hypothetical protein